MRLDARALLLTYLLLATVGCQQTSSRSSTPKKTPSTTAVEDEHEPMNTTITIRLKPHADLYASLEKIVAERELKAASIVAAVGSLEVVALRFADKKETTVIEGKHEIISLSGTMSDAGIHVHMSVSDGNGKVTGGHIKPGSKVYTTAEIVLMESTAEVYDRVLDETYGYKELSVSKR